MKKSLTLYSTIGLLCSHAYAVDVDSFDLGMGLSYITTTLGNPKDSKQKLMGGTLKNPIGTITSATYFRPALYTSAALRFANGHFKLSTEFILPSNEESIIYNGKPEDSSHSISVAVGREKNRDGDNAVGIIFGQDAVLETKKPHRTLEHTKVQLEAYDENIGAKMAFTPLNKAPIKILKFRTPAAFASSPQVDHTAVVTTLEDRTIQRPFSLDGDFRILAEASDRKLVVKPRSLFAIKAEYVFEDLSASSQTSLGIALMRNRDELIFSAELNNKTSAYKGTNAFSRPSSELFGQNLVAKINSPDPDTPDVKTQNLFIDSNHNNLALNNEGFGSNSRFKLLSRFISDGGFSPCLYTTDKTPFDCGVAHANNNVNNPISAETEGSIGVFSYANNDKVDYYPCEDDTCSSKTPVLPEIKTINEARHKDTPYVHKSGQWWFGITSSNQTSLTEHLKVSSNIGYYLSIFSKNKASDTSMILFADDITADCFIGSIALTFTPE